MHFQSHMQQRGEANLFPVHTDERHYMVPFSPGKPLPAKLDRWQGLVDQMMLGVETDRTCFIMIDQGYVQPDKALRRPGIHIDGYWNGTMWSHGGSVGGGGGHRPSSGHHSVPLRERRHVGIPPQQDRHKSTPTSPYDDPWSTATFEAPEAIILASDQIGCIGYTGEFEGPIGDMGCCGNVDLGDLTEHLLLNNHVYAGNVTFLHQSVPITTGPRTLVRINTPGWSPPI